MIAGICLIVSYVMLVYLLYDMDKRIKQVELFMEKQIEINRMVVNHLEQLESQIKINRMVVNYLKQLEGQNED